MPECSIGLMQPYFFPYIGYFQYIDAADKFVIFDDVQFVMRGWINRNRILLNHKEYLFSVPLCKPSPNKLICEIKINYDQKWQEKLLQTIAQAYKKTKFYNEIFPGLERVILDINELISEAATRSIEFVCNLLKLKSKIIRSSRHYDNRHLEKKERILDIAKKEKASEIIVPATAGNMYPKRWFEERDMGIAYLEPKLKKYEQTGNEFIPRLSIIDLLMFNGIENTMDLLEGYTVQ